MEWWHWALIGLGIFWAVSFLGVLAMASDARGNDKFAMLIPVALITAVLAILLPLMIFYEGPRAETYREKVDSCGDMTHLRLHGNHFCYTLAPDGSIKMFPR